MDELQTAPRPIIGTLREGALHAQLKEWYRHPGDEVEKKLSGYVVDIVRGDLLIEIQTGGFAPLRRKLDVLTREHPVRVVAPVARERRIVRLSGEGEILSSRRSPRHGAAVDVFARLVSIPTLLCRPGFELEILLTEEEEVRVHQAGKAFRRHGWVVSGRSLAGVSDRVRLAGPEDAAALLPTQLPQSFDTAELAEAAAVSRRLAQQMTYCLRAMGMLEIVGNRRRAHLYRRSQAALAVPSG
ncbi:MAG: hypothetical protein WBQ14_00860 [Gaiellaceae bacterium]